NNYANTLARERRFAEAVTQASLVLDGRMRVFGARHEKTIQAATNLTLDFLEARDYKKAGEAFNIVLPLCIARLGPDHELSQSMRANHCRYLVETRSYAEAERELR